MANKEPWPLSFGPLNVFFTLVGTLVVIPFPNNVQLMTGGISGAEKSMSLFFSVFVCYFSVVVLSLCKHSCVHIYTTHFVDNIPGRGEKNKNKTTFKERVKFPKLECTVEIRTEHSRLCRSRQIGCQCCNMCLFQVGGVIDGQAGNFVMRKTCENSFFYSIFFKKPLEALMQI